MCNGTKKELIRRLASCVTRFFYMHKIWNKFKEISFSLIYLKIESIRKKRLLPPISPFPFFYLFDDDISFCLKKKQTLTKKDWIVMDDGERGKQTKRCEMMKKYKNGTHLHFKLDLVCYCDKTDQQTHL